MTNPFDKLKGILPPREIKTSEESPLERLIKLNRELEREIVLPDDWYFKIHKFRLNLYEQISKRAGSYDVQDISNLTTALSFEESKNQRTRGAYIGGLLSLLTEKNHKLNKTTSLEIDLKRREFPYLFLACKYVDTLKISNIKGDYVGSWIADYNGKCDILDKEGKYSPQLKQFIEEQRQKYIKHNGNIKKMNMFLNKEIKEFYMSIMEKNGKN
ncbi:MAG: hypothetical protein AABW65_01305 [Nanoarchaeota archaeon]